MASGPFPNVQWLAPINYVFAISGCSRAPEPALFLLVKKAARILCSKKVLVLVALLLIGVGVLFSVLPPVKQRRHRTVLVPVQSRAGDLFA